MYEELSPLLRGIAVRRFGIDAGEAEALVHEVFLAYLLRAETVMDVRAFLIGAICNASRYHLRVQRRMAELPEDAPGCEAASVPVQVTVRAAVACLSAQCQLVLRLRFWDGYTVPEIAATLGTTKKYAAKVLAKCLCRAKEHCGGCT